MGKLFGLCDINSVTTILKLVKPKHKFLFEGHSIEKFHKYILFSI